MNYKLLYQLEIEAHNKTLQELEFYKLRCEAMDILLSKYRTEKLNNRTENTVYSLSSNKANIKINHINIYI